MGVGSGGLARTRVLIVEDHEFFRRGLRLLLERHGFDVVGEAGSGEQALELARSTRPDVVLMDLHLPGISGAEAAVRLSAAAPPPAILMLTVSSRSADLYAALASGASGYVLKGSSSEEIVQALRSVASGDAHVSRSLTAALVRRMHELGAGALAADDSRDPLLTDRELEVLRLMSRGEPNAEIARGLAISEHTVKSHVGSILAKLEVANRVQATALAIRRGLI